MDLGQLFVNLGVKGDDKAVDALTKLKKGFKDTASEGLAAKAALLGALYATERMFAGSNQRGNELTNFNALMGTGTQTLQRYQYAARQVGVSNDELAGSFKGLASISTKVLTGKGAPEGTARVAQIIGARTDEMQKLFTQATQGHPEALLQALQTYASREQNQGLRNEVLKGFGLSDNMTAALVRQAFTPQQLAQAPTYGEGEVKQLDKNNAAWGNLSNKFEMMVGHFNAAHGGQLVKDLSIITDKVFALATAFEKLSEKAHFFELLGKAFSGWAQIFQTTIEVIDKVNALSDLSSDDPKKKKKAEEVLGDWKKDLAQMGSAALEAITGESLVTPEEIIHPKALTPKESQAAQAAYEKEHPFEIRARKWIQSKAIPALENVLGKGALTPPPSEPGAPGKPGEPGKAATPGQPGEPGKAAAPAQPGKPGEPGVTPTLPGTATPTVTPSAAAAPAMPGVPQASNTQNQTSISQTLNFNGDVNDPKKTADSVQKAVQTAYRQIGAQARIV